MRYTSEDGFKLTDEEKQQIAGCLAISREHARFKRRFNADIAEAQRKLNERLKNGYKLQPGKLW